MCVGNDVYKIETETIHHQKLDSVTATSHMSLSDISESMLNDILGTVNSKRIRDSMQNRLGLLHGWIPLIETKFLFESPATDHAAEGP